MRLRHKPWAEGEIQAHSDLVISNPQAYKGKWDEVFQNNYPIHIELGTGKGQFITQMAQAHSTINYIGVELQTSVIVGALQKAKEAQLPNLRLLNQNVADLAQFFAYKELKRIYINFNDPWPKKRHEKRRLTHHLFLNQYDALLGEGGEIELKTDNKDLFEFSLNSFADYGCRLKNISFDLHESPLSAGNRMTEYEEKFSSKGNPIYYCIAILPGRSGDGTATDR